MEINKQNIMKRQTILSTAWIFVLLNMIYADILGMLRPGYLDFLEKMSKELSGMDVLVFSILMEVVIAMVLLSRMLQRKWNRRVHFIAVPLSILWVVVPALMPSLGDSTPVSYVFFASIEVLAMLGILLYAWRWPVVDDSNL